MPIDIIDQAQDRTEELIKQSLHKTRKTLTIPYSGKCLSCEEPVQEARFCCLECRDHYESELRKKSPYR